MNWIELVESNREKIEEEMCKACERSYEEYLGVRDGYIEVALKENGETSIYWVQQNEMAGDIYENKAISLARFKVMNDFDYDYTPIFDYLSEEEQESFIKACDENDMTHSDQYIEEWNAAIYERIMEEAISDLFDSNAEEILHEIDRKIEDTLVSLAYRQEGESVTWI